MVWSGINACVRFWSIALDLCVKAAHAERSARECSVEKRGLKLHFLTEDTWEVRDPILQSFQGAGSRLFPCVEVGLNLPLWHLDLLASVGEEVEYWRRFILTSIEQAAATLAEYKGQCRLHFQSAKLHDDRASYEIWPVQRLLTGRDPTGRPAHVVVLPHRQFLYPDRDMSASELTDVRCLYEVHEC